MRRASSRPATLDERFDVLNLRVPGKGKGRFVVARDFDEPLPDDVIAAFEGRAR